MPEYPAETRQRLRLTYRHGASLRYISHLDLIRVFERALRRAGLPIAYTQGFNPRPRITWAAPLPVGFASEAELVDFLLNTPMEPGEFAARLAPQLPAGLTILAVEEVPRQWPALPSLLRSAHYRVTLLGRQDIEAVQNDVERLLAEEQIERPRRGPAHKTKSFNLRPRILTLHATCSDAGVVLDMELCAQSNATARPDDVLDALGYSGWPCQITRTSLSFAST